MCVECLVIIYERRFGGYLKNELVVYQSYFHKLWLEEVGFP